MLKHPADQEGARALLRAAKAQQQRVVDAGQEAMQVVHVRMGLGQQVAGA